MKTPSDPSSVVYLLLVAFLLGALMWLFAYNLTSSRGIHEAFTTEDEGEQIVAEAEIRAEGISKAFKTGKKGKQNFEKATIICHGDSSWTVYLGQNLLNILLRLMENSFGGKK